MIFTKMLKLKQIIRRINHKAHFWLLRNEVKKPRFYIKKINLWTRENFEIQKIYL